MNTLIKASLVAALGLGAVSAMADESFGGIGVTITQVPQGVRVAEVIPGTPAAESKIQPGDEIIAVDGVSLSGKDMEFSKSKLRGVSNKPLEITYVSGGDTLSAILRRAQMTVKSLDGESVEKWYGKSSFSAEELAAYASATENGKQFIAVLQRGTIIESESEVSSQHLDGIYVEKVDEFAPKSKGSVSAARSGDAKLRGFTRNAVSLSVKAPGSIQVSVLNADGVLVASLRKDNAVAGIHTLSWDGSTLPSGRYMVNIEHNGGVNGKFAVLK